MGQQGQETTRDNRGQQETGVNRGLGRGDRGRWGTKNNRCHRTTGTRDNKGQQGTTAGREQLLKTSETFQKFSKTLENVQKL
ncbi:hypothetical protein PV326_011749 [Microctonus aethiopoides]|nr:hypothetical protein PV326_011749 [Microctonus aethiopoides]